MTQAEADGLIAVLKRLLTIGGFNMPDCGEGKNIDLQSVFNRQDTFIIDVRRPSTIRVRKYTLQLRYRKEVILLRLDYEGPPHQNPDGVVVPCPHMHIWREGSGVANDAWAFPIPVAFSTPSDFVRTLYEFLEYSNVEEPKKLRIEQRIKIDN